ncbi:hypothetical protein RxyAA322_26670 [Rubrobacter xylanophilus]|uniref:Uncharacterized protein n=1 Tax=Rubrobacter xylanophilus TaxID=49319 RepID=A0A510HPJ8_9ACTN|nr:hypothetical protein RxyAA322_26670 [Rubrobacter xylanophilus]
MASRRNRPVDEDERRALPSLSRPGDQRGHPRHLAVGDGGLRGEGGDGGGEQRRPEDRREHHHRPDLRRNPRPEEEGEENRGERRPGQHEELDLAGLCPPRPSVPRIHPGLPPGLPGEQPG